VSTLAGRRAELIAALVAGEVDVAPTPGRATPPCVLVYGNGIADMTGIGRSQVPVGFRLVLVSGSVDQEASAELLDALTLVVLGILRALPWPIGPLERDTIRKLGLGEYLTRDITATAMVDIS